MKSPVAALALDLGSTRFKLGVLHGNGELELAAVEPAPPLRGAGLIREGEPDAFLTAASTLVDMAADRWPGVPLGVVSQRSTFTVWDRDRGRALMPMISWQDRRAAGWCARHRDVDPVMIEHAGLLLSPHYLGPKLAAMLEDPAWSSLAAALRNGAACVGTLDAWLTWHWTRPRQHQTDMTMAARTGLADIERGTWSQTLCRRFGVPDDALPRLAPTDRQRLELANGLTLTASLADQAAGACAVLNPEENAALVNFGTGTFVLYPHADATLRKPGYLTAPVLAAHGRDPWFVLEGTINGGGPALDRFDLEPTALPGDDDCPEGFAVPELTGIGAPHWREDVGLTLSSAAQAAAPAVKRRIVLEGLLFRVLEILEAMSDGQVPGRILISGGVVRDPAVALGLARLLEQPVGQLAERESTLLGAARLAAGWQPHAPLEVQLVHPTPAGAYLRDKYPRWRRWLHEVLRR